MKKFLFLILILIIIGVAIWSGLQKEPETQIAPPVNQIEEILTEAVNITKLNFGEIKDSEFGWLENATSTQITIFGKEISVSNISTDEQENIVHFLTAKGFTKNELNVASGTVSEIQGYKNDNIACVIVSGLAGYEDAPADWVPDPDNTNKDVNLICGFIKKPATTSITDEDNINGATDNQKTEIDNSTSTDMGEKPALE